MKIFRILILEDDLETLSVLTGSLFKLERELGDIDVGVTIFSEYTQVEDYVNNSDFKFDLVILDYDCKICGSFHALDLAKFDAKKIIAISTQPEYNIKVTAKGAVECRKDYREIEEWGKKIADEVKNFISQENYK